MRVQFVHNSCYMKTQLLGINICVYLKNIDKLYKLQHYFVWDSDGSHGFPYSTVLKISQFLPTNNHVMVP